MNSTYEEIIMALGPPRWWNEDAAPRYVPFSPRALANIYAAECVLEEVACQGCEERFRVAMSQSAASKAMYGDWVFPPHYGDPPNINCCAGGPTMNVEFIRVVEHWKYVDHVWVRQDQPATGE